MLLGASLPWARLWERDPMAEAKADDAKASYGDEKGAAGGEEGWVGPVLAPPAEEKETGTCSVALCVSRKLSILVSCPHEAHTYHMTTPQILSGERCGRTAAPRERPQRIRTSLIRCRRFA